MILGLGIMCSQAVLPDLADHTTDSYSAPSSCHVREEWRSETGYSARRTTSLHY